MDFECWKGTHLIFTLAFSLPVLILWSFGIPLTGIIFLTLN